MDYQDLVNSLTEISVNENIYKKGLKVIYELDEENHKKLDEHLFFANPNNTGVFKHSDMFEVESDGVIIQIIKKK